MTKTELAHHLTIVSIEMLHLALAMEAIGEEVYTRHAAELAGAAELARNWSAEIGRESLAAVGPEAERAAVGASGRCCGSCHYRVDAACDWAKRRVGAAGIPYWYWIPYGMVRMSDGKSCLAYVPGTSGVGP